MTLCNHYINNTITTNNNNKTTVASKKLSTFQQQIEKLNDLSERRLEQFIGDAANKHQMEMDEIDERKSNQIVKLIEKHENAFADMQNYYDDIVQSNLELIESLKKQMQALADQFEKSEQRLKKVRELCCTEFTAAVENERPDVRNVARKKEWRGCLASN